jgi:hypothetical protein
MFGGFLFGKLLARPGSLTLLDAVDQAFHVPFTSMWRPKEFCGIFNTEPSLAGGLIEQGQERN